MTNMSGDGTHGGSGSNTRDSSGSAWQVAGALNRHCHCISVDERKLKQGLDARLGSSGAYSQFQESHPHLLAKSPVFVSREHVEQMARTIKAIESVVGLGGYQDLVLGWAPDIASTDYGPGGAFFGYDFHLTRDGPKLIEVNTNAGGALLVYQVAAAQQACCREVEHFVAGSVDLGRLEEELVTMFRRELELQFPGRALRRVAIVDEDPTAQYLGPEFILMRQMFDQQGIDAIIVGPDELELRDGQLCAAGQAIDLVYNRLTDFYLQSPPCRVLARAYRDQVVAVTPGPHTHALYANKRNLAVLSDPESLACLGADASAAETLAAAIPKSVLVSSSNADALWADRRHLFFKPLWGYGSRGTYRGSKLTRRKWQEILEAEYVAQELVPPSERLLVVDGDQQALKLDVRCYVYDGSVQLLGARMYRGQTTNFRTYGGGLAAVFTTSEVLG
jgi:glutathione synthase/RimK-type ligase-like ATP-grasp enzyme